jgi:hypothetical protein
VIIWRPEDDGFLVFFVVVVVVKLVELEDALISPTAASGSDKTLSRPALVDDDADDDDDDDDDDDKDEDKIIVSRSLQQEKCD